MIRLIKDHMQELKELCVRYHVQQFEVFGSAAGEERFDAESDVDFLVEFLPLEAGQHADTYFGLLEGIEDVLERPVDLVMTGTIKNRYFLEAISQNREVLYAA